VRFSCAASFVLFPRISPDLGLPQDANNGMSGLSDSFRQYQQSDAKQRGIAFRVCNLKRKYPLIIIVLA
jgi:hypothetical protein